MSTHDKQGRPWAKLLELKPGDEIDLDSGFTCASGRKTVKATQYGLAFDCAEGESAHVISGHADDGEHCVGVYRAG